MRPVDEAHPPVSPCQHQVRGAAVERAPAGVARSGGGCAAESGVADAEAEDGGHGESGGGFGKGRWLRSVWYGWLRDWELGSLRPGIGVGEMGMEMGDWGRAGGLSCRQKWVPSFSGKGRGGCCAAWFVVSLGCAHLCCCRGLLFC